MPAQELVVESHTISAWVYGQAGDEAFIYVYYAGATQPGEFQPAHAEVLQVVKARGLRRTVWDHRHVMMFPEDAAWARWPYNDRYVEAVRANAGSDDVLWGRSALVRAANPYDDYVLECYTQEMNERVKGHGLLLYCKTVPEGIAFVRESLTL